MLAVVNTPGGAAPVELGEVPEPQPAANEALVEVRAFSLNRGELRLFQTRPEGWRPGQDIGGVGHMAVQFAARSGARVTAVVGGPERGRHLRGADEIVEGIDKVQGRFALILESAGGSSLAAAIARIEAKGTIVIFGNSSGDPTPFSFRNLAEHPNARIQGFSYFTSEAEDRFAPDLALLAGLVADGSLKPHLVEHSWRELARIGPLLRDRQIRGKAVFHID